MYRCSVCTQRFTNSVSLHDHCELLSHWSEDEDDVDSDEFFFSEASDDAFHDDDWLSYNPVASIECVRVTILFSISLFFPIIIFFIFHFMNILLLMLNRQAEIHKLGTG